MPRTVAEGFDVLLGRIPPSDAVTEKARRNRDSLEACLRADFTVTKFFRVGSFGHGTNIPKHSDVDYFVVLPEDELPADSAKALREIKNALARRFVFTDIRVSSPVVLVPFGQTPSERFEIMPAFADEDPHERETFWIPDRQTGGCPQRRGPTVLTQTPSTIGSTSARSRSSG